MLKLIRNNKKFVLAGLMILSMLTFVVNRGNGNGANSTDHEVGTIGGKTIFSSEMAESRAEMSAIKNYVTFSEEDRDFLSQSLHQLVYIMGQRPELFFLLRHEARAAGVQVSNDDVLSFMVNHARDLTPDTDPYDATLEGVTDLLKIQSRFEQVASAIKISKPMVDRVMVADHQTIQATLVPLNAQDYLSKVPPPTTQQVQDQFKTFASTTPHHPVPTTNPFGFGYKLPMRAQVQYLRISAEAVETAVIATKTFYDWEVAANKYYLLNSSEFIPKSSTTTATTQPLVAPPLAAVHDQVLQKIRQPMETALLDQVQGFISTTLNSDYQTYTRALSSTPPAAEPDSSLGVAYSSFTYLSKLIAKVQATYKVAITVGQSPDYWSDQQIGAIPGVGSPALAKYITDQATSYLAQVEAKNPSASAQLFRPSPPLQGFENTNSAAFIRMTDARPSQPPPNVDAVRPTVQDDVRLQSAYDLAKTQASLLLTAANTGTLQAAAQATGHQVIALDADSALSMETNDVKAIFPPLGDSAQSFMTQAFQLLGPYDPAKNPHPAELIELPEQQRLFVAQLTFVNAGWNSETYFRDAIVATLIADKKHQEMMLSSWFNYDAVVQRLEFKTQKSSKE